MQAWGVSCGAAGLVLLPILLVFVLDEGPSCLFHGGSALLIPQPPASHLLFRALQLRLVVTLISLGLGSAPWSLLETVAFLSCSGRGHTLPDRVGRWGPSETSELRVGAATVKSCPESKETAE